MLNNKGERELAYTVVIDDIHPIEGSDNCEAAVVGGWQVMVRKGTFQPGDIAIYFEIDSHLDTNKPCFNFLATKKGNIKTQRYTFGGKGNFLSQGLLMAITDVQDETPIQDLTSAGIGLTDRLSVTYIEAEDNVRKGKIKRKQQSSAIVRHYHQIHASRIARWLMNYRWGQWLVKRFWSIYDRFHRNPRKWPKLPYVKRTDEERIENRPDLLQYKEPLIVTEKLDGTSTTFILIKRRFYRYDFYVCSRNFVLPEDDSIYWEMARKYNVEARLKEYLKSNKKLQYVALQGESVGDVQGNPLKLTENDFYGFNFIRSDVGRISSLDGLKLLDSWGMKWVPVLRIYWENPDTMEEMKAAADGQSRVNPAVLREGLVYRSAHDPKMSFKNVSNAYLLQKK